MSNLNPSLSNPAPATQALDPWNVKPAPVICHIYGRCAHYQEEQGNSSIKVVKDSCSIKVEEDSSSIKDEEERGKKRTVEEVASPEPMDRATKKRKYKARKLAERRTKQQRQAKLDLCGDTSLITHVSRNNPKPMIRFFNKSFLCWTGPSCNLVVAVVKFHPFSAMDPTLKAQYENLSRHLVAQSALPTTEKKTNDHQYIGELFSLGWEKEVVSDDQEGHKEPQAYVPAINHFINERFQFVSSSLFTQFKDQHNLLQAPESEPDSKDDPNRFTSHLSFTLGNFADLPHTDDHASPFSFAMWIPIQKTTGEIVEQNFQVQGGEFVFPDKSFGINFSGFDGVVECAWNATAFSHLTLPSVTPPHSSHTRMSLSYHLPQKTQVAPEKSDE